MATIKTPKATGAWARGYSAVKHSKDPEGWLRGSASLDTETGELAMKLQLETDSTASGPRGFLTVHLRDESNKVIGSVTTGTVWIGGKPPGKAKRKNFKFAKKLPAKLAKATASVSARMTQKGKKVQLWSVPLKDVIEAAEKAIVIISKL
jgi:hypothetical protein